MSNDDGDASGDSLSDPRDESGVYDDGGSDLEVWSWREEVCDSDRICVLERRRFRVG